jgi:hypothetical protein
MSGLLILQQTFMRSIPMLSDFRWWVSNNSLGFTFPPLTKWIKDDTEVLFPNGGARGAGFGTQAFYCSESSLTLHSAKRTSRLNFGNTGEVLTYLMMIFNIKC